MRGLVMRRPWRGKIMSVVSESEYKGNPMLVIKNSEEDKFPFQFGLKKAKLSILIEGLKLSGENKNP